MYQYQNEPHRFNNLGKNELARRIKLIEEIMDMVNGQLTQEYRAVNDNQVTLSQYQAEDFARGQDKEFDQTRHLDNGGVLSLQKKMLKESDGQLTQVIGIVQATKYEAQGFSTTIKQQNAKIGKLGTSMDHTEENMVETESKM